MKQYKGYYIDNITFNNEKEIDEFIKEQTISKYKMLCKMFAEDSCMELIVMMTPYEEKLHNMGLSYEDIEQLEIEAIA